AVLEAADHEVAGLDGGHRVADLLDHADVLVPDGYGPLDLGDPAVAPQVGAAHAGGDGTDEGVGRLDDDGVRALLEADVPRAMDDCSSHVPIEHALRRPARRGRVVQRVAARTTSASGVAG